MNNSKVKSNKPKRKVAPARAYVEVTAAKVQAPKKIKPRPNRQSRAMGMTIQGDAILGGGKKPRAMGFYKNLARVYDPIESRIGNRQVVVNDEYIGELAGSVAFAYTAYPLNPGQATTFPWLSKLAALYEKYRFLYFEFYYAREVTEFANNGQAGKVMLHLDTNSSDSPPSSKNQVLDTYPHVDGMPCEYLCLSLDTPLLRSKTDAFFVRPGPLPGGSDIKTYDLGILYASTNGNTTTTTVGELRVRYAVELLIPVLESSTVAPINYRLTNFLSTGAAEPAGANGVLKQMLLATVNTNGLGLTNTAGLIVLPVGNYEITGSALATGSGLVITYLQVQLFVNGVAVNPPAFNSVGTTPTNFLSAGDSWFVTSNGATTVALDATVGYASGSVSLNGSLTIQSI